MSKLTEKMRLPDRGAGQGGLNNLAILWAKIMASIRLTPSKIEENNRAYVRNPLNGIPDDSGKRSSAAGNIRKEIERNNMTWRVFEKLLRWARPKSAKVFVVVEWKDGTVTTENINIRIDNYVVEDEDERPLSERSNEELLEELRQRGVPVVIPGLDPEN